MSYRKHRTVAELRTERTKHRMAIECARHSIALREKAIAEQQQEIADMKHNIWKREQMIGSCNLWIARKETGQCI